MKNKLGFLFLAALIAGCTSNSGGPGGGAAPKGNVNTKIAQSGTAALTANTAIFEAGQGARGPNLMQLKTLESTSAKASQSKSEAQKMTQAKKDRVLTAMQNGNCKMDFVNPSDSLQAPSQSMAAQFPKLKMKVSGASCPMEMSLEMHMGSNMEDICQEAQGVAHCKFSYKVNMTYRVLEQKLKEELGVVSGEMSMVFNADETLPADFSPEEAFTQITKMKADMNLKVVDLDSQVYLISGLQDIDIKMIQSMSGHQMNFAVTGAAKEEFRYFAQATNTESNLVATAVFNGTSATEKYLVDGVEVTAEAYMAERDKFANSMLNSNDSGNQGEQNPPVETEPPTDLQPLPGQPTPAPAPPVNPTPVPFAGYACMLQDNVSRNVFIAYASQERIASSKVKQACQQATGNSCNGFADCEQQELNSSAWFCEASNAGKVFGGFGASKVEAQYFAKKDCIEQTNSGSWYVHDSDCVHQ